MYLAIPGISLIIYSSINSTSGDIVLGISDVVLITKSKGSIIKLSTTSDSEMTNVSVYQDICSGIRQIQQVSNSTSQLTVSKNMTYGIEELYLIKTFIISQ